MLINKKITYAGWIMEDDFGFLSLAYADKENPKSLAEQLSLDWNSGEIVSVRYYVSDLPITEDGANRQLILDIAGASLDTSYQLEAYSEWTILEWEEELKAGGHDLGEELRTYEGKYVILVINSANTITE